MSTHSASSYSLSLMLHGAFVAAMLFTAFALREETADKTTKIFELVAGEGNNWAATEAPAIGTPDGVKFQPSPRPVEQPKPEPISPPQAQPEPVIAPPTEPSPVAATPVEPPPVAPKVEPKKTPPQKTFAEQVKQIADRKERQQMTKHRRAEAARAKKEAAEEAKRKAAEAAAAKRMSYDEFSKNNPQKVASNSKSSASSSSYQKISTKGITGGVEGGTTDQPGAGGKVLSRAEQDRLLTYFTLLKQKVREAHVTPLGVTNQPSARVSFFISASGTISQIKIIRSSGNAVFDQSVIAAFKAVGSIGPRPDGRSDTRESDFNTKDTD